MPFVSDSRLRPARRVIRDGNASCKTPTTSTMSDLSGLKFASRKDGYRSSVAHDSSRYITVSDLSEVQRILYGSGFDRGHEFTSSFVAEIGAQTRWSGNPFSASSGIGPSRFGDRAFGAVGGRVGSNQLFGRPGSSLENQNSLQRSLVYDADLASDLLDPKVRSVTDAELRTFGTVALSQTNPLVPPAQLLVALAELVSDGLPPALGKAILMKGGSRAGLISRMAGEYLNYIFGYKPVVDEIFNTLSTFELMDVLIKQWKRNVGMETRRSFSSKQSTHRWVTNVDRRSLKTYGLYARGGPDVDLNATWYEKYGVASGYDISSNHSTSAWGSGSYTRDMRFSGAYWYNVKAITDLNIPEPFASYLRNKDKGALMDSLMALKLLGLGEAATTVAWQLTPFSWMIDWFINLGDLFAAIDTHLSKNIQLRYGYVTSREVWKEDLLSSLRSNTGTLSMQASITRVRMRRIRATPFGFGTTFDGLSVDQAKVLAALAAVFYGGSK